MTRAVGSASPMMRMVAATAAFASLYFLVAVLTGRITGGSGVAVLWPASGVYLGVLLIAPRQMWSALACAAGIGSLAAYLNAGSSLEVSVAFAVPSSAEGLLGALLVERIARKRFTLGGLHDLFALVLGGAVVANALVALSAGAVAAQTFGVSFAESWLRWWSADALGIIAVAPVITAAPQARRLRAVGLGGLGIALVATYLAVDDEVYALQAFLAGLLLSSLAAAAALGERDSAVAERDRALAERERLSEGAAHELEDTGRRAAQLTAELAARTAELHDAGRRREQLAQEVRDSQAATARTERELGDARGALAEAERALAEAKRARAEAERALAEAEGGRADAERALPVAERACAEAESARAEAERSLAEVGREREGLRRELALAAAGRERVQHELDDRTSALRRLQAELESARAELEHARVEQTRITEQLSGAVSGRERVEHALERAHAEFAEQRARLERSLEEASERLARADDERRALAARAAEPSARYDNRGTCLDASPAFCRLLDYEPAELVGRPGAELLHADDRPRLAQARASRSESRFEARLRRKAGDFVPVEVTLRPVWDRDQRLVEIRTTFRDISEKHAAGQRWRFPQAQSAA